MRNSGSRTTILLLLLVAIALAGWATGRRITRLDRQVESLQKDMAVLRTQVKSHACQPASAPAGVVADQPR